MHVGEGETHMSVINCRWPPLEIVSYVVSSCTGGHILPELNLNVVATQTRTYIYD